MAFAPKVVVFAIIVVGSQNILDLDHTSGYASESSPPPQHSRTHKEVCSSIQNREEDRRVFPRSIDYAVKIRVNQAQTGVETNVKHSMVCSVLFGILLFSYTM